MNTSSGRCLSAQVSIAKVLVAVRAPLFLLLGLLLWFGMLSYVFMDQLCRPADGCDQQAEFGTLPASFMSILVLLTTANFPDLMMDAYTYNRLFALPFVVFLLYALFFVMNVLLAHVYSSYTEQLRQQAAEFGHNRHASLDLAFNMLVESSHHVRGQKISLLSLFIFFH